MSDTDPFKQTGERLYDQLDDDNITTGVSDSTDIDCWRETFLQSALENASRMVTQASMDADTDEDSMHPSAVLADDNVDGIHVFAQLWDAPSVVIEVDEFPDWGDRTITETRTVHARKKPGRSQDRAIARVQVRPSY